jgi:hypothetical protein
MSAQVRGAGVELLMIEVEATPAQVHEALVAAGGQRDTTAEEWHRGLEVITLDESAFAPMLRALHPVQAPSLTWLGVPVRWTTAIQSPEGRIVVRAWPLSLEVGEAALIDVALDFANALRRERLLLPGRVLVLAPGGSAFPLDPQGQPAPGPVTRAMVGRNVRLLAFRPRFQAAQVR